jgi:quinol monooxygenase YgiN
MWVPPGTSAKRRVCSDTDLGYAGGMAFALLNRLAAKPGERDVVVRNLLDSGRLFDDNPACLLYLVVEAVDDPDGIWVVDLWSSEEEHSTALQAPELRRYVSETVPLLRGAPEQIQVRVAGGKSPGVA